MTQLQPLVDENGSEVWDSSKLQSYLDCMQKGWLGYEHHLVPNYPSEALAFGKGFHRAAEVWTNVALGKETHPVGPIEAGQAAFLEVWEQELPLELREKLEFEGNRRSYANFCRLFGAYTRKFPLEMFDEILALEIPFTLYLGTTPAGREIAWSGILDRTVRWQGEVYYVDIKTGAYPLEKTFEEYRFRGQFFGYGWAGAELDLGDFAGVMVQGVHVVAPPKTTRGTKTVDDLVGADIISLSAEHIEEWKRDTLFKIDEIHRAREAGVFTMNRGPACNYYGGCSFKQLCSAYPSLRALRQEKNFVQKAWNPITRNREEVRK